MTDSKVRAEKVRTLYRQTTAVLLTNTINSVIVCVMLWNSAPKSQLLGWITLLGATSISRMLLFRRYQKTPPAPHAAELWGARFVVGSVTAGTLWGGAGFLLLPQASNLSQLLITFVIGGMCAAAAGTLASHLPAFFAFVAPALTALSLRMVLFGDSTHVIMAVITLIYGFGLFAVANVNHRVFTEAFSLRFENEKLLGKLSRAQSRLEETNRTLEERVIERSEAFRKQSEALRDAQRMEAVGRLAGGVAHDFNNLLTIILANLSEIIENRQLGEPFIAILKEMHDAAVKGADLVRQLLLFSRRQRTVSKILDLNHAVSDMEKLLSRLLGEQLTLRLVLSDSHLYVNVDPTQIEQVIINLVTNARDAMTSGGVATIETRTVELREATDGLSPGRYVLLLVSDTGSGMDSDTRHLIFDPFFTTKDVGKGTGLGLASVYGIVEQSGGHIRVSSELHRGSSFSIYLPPATPLANAIVTEGLVGRTALALDKPSKASPAATVLLVEDEPTVRAVIERILKHEGHRVISARSAEQALALCEGDTGPIALLVTDVVMAGMDGPALASHLRSVRPEIRTLFISGYSRNHVIPEDAQDGRVRFLSKPFTYASFMTEVTKLLTHPATDSADTHRQ